MKTPIASDGEGYSDPEEIAVDIRTRVLPADHGVFIARPGAESRLFDDFMGARAVGAELPGVELVPGIPVREQPNLDAMLRRAVAVRAWARKPKDTVFPSRDLSAYLEGPTPKGRPNYITILEGYFQAARKGDLVVVPPQAYRDHAVLAEFADDPGTITYVQSRRFPGFSLPARNIRSLTRVKKLDLPNDLLETLTLPISFVSIAKSARAFLYDMAYGSYTIEGDFSARIDILNENYSAEDEFNILAFAKFVAAGCLASAHHNDVPGFRDAAFASLGDHAPQLQTNINSPGWLSLKSPYIIPQAMVILFALAVEVGVPALAAAQNNRIAIVNSSAAADDPCVARVSVEALRLLKLYGVDEWTEACRVARQVAKETGARVNPRVTER